MTNHDDQSRITKAEDCQCCECGQQAVAVVDPDIPSHPYCRTCLDKAKNQLLIRLADEGLI